MSETQHTAGETIIKDSGARREFATGAHRDRAVGKGAFHLIPYAGLERIAQIFEAGAIKYTESNFRLGMPVAEYINSALRHGHKAADGWTDEDHLAMCAWNCIAAMETQRLAKVGAIPPELGHVHDFLTPEGIEAAFAKIRAANAERLQCLAPVPDANDVV